MFLVSILYIRWISMCFISDYLIPKYRYRINDRARFDFLESFSWFFEVVNLAAYHFMLQLSVVTDRFDYMKRILKLQILAEIVFKVNGFWNIEIRGQVFSSLVFQVYYKYF